MVSRMPDGAMNNSCWGRRRSIAMLTVAKMLSTSHYVVGKRPENSATTAFFAEERPTSTIGRPVLPLPVIRAPRHGWRGGGAVAPEMPRRDGRVQVPEVEISELRTPPCGGSRSLSMD